MLLPYMKWTKEYPKRKSGYIILIHYPGIERGTYRMARVNTVFPDQMGRVRTMEVLMRPRQKNVDGSKLFTPKDLEPMRVPVQRTVLILPVEQIENKSSVGETGEAV